MVLAHRLLRTTLARSGFTEGFQILDSDDQYRYDTRVIKSRLR